MKAIVFAWVYKSMASARSILTLVCIAMIIAAFNDIASYNVFKHSKKQYTAALIGKASFEKISLVNYAYSVKGKVYTKANEVVDGKTYISIKDSHSANVEYLVEDNGVSRLEGNDFDDRSLSNIVGLGLLYGLSILWRKELIALLDRFQRQ